MSTILSYTDYIDWKAFIVAKLGEDLRDRYQAVKQVAPRHHRDQPRRRGRAVRFAAPLGRPGRRLDDGEAGGFLRHVVLSRSTPRSWIATSPWRAALLDFTRSFGYDEGRDGFWVGELQGGFGTIAREREPDRHP